MILLKIFRTLLTLPIRLYQWVISPLFPGSCNYYPTCSEYSRQAILKHGMVKGISMAVLRVGRCSALFDGGNDPVPEVFDFKDLTAEYRRRSVKRREKEK